MNYRVATPADACLLAALNHALIRDEGHRNRMNVEELTQRMVALLADGYQGIIFEADDSPLGYALYRIEPEWIYLRQFYVKTEFRRQGIGRAALEWLRANAWSGHPRIRLEVLVGNSVGVAFWRAVDFSDYCLTMELEQTHKPEHRP